MQTTTNLGLNKPDEDDIYNVGDFNDNMDKIDENIKKLQDKSISDEKPTFAEASSRANIESGEELKVIFGKIRKFFTDLKSVAFSGSYADLNNKPSTATTSANGFMSSADKTKLDGITDSADAVSVSRSLTSGTKIGTITINGTEYDLYCQTNTDTKNTAGTTNKTATKMYLAGATSQAANPVTYSNSNCYIGTDNELYSGGKKVAHQADVDTLNSNLQETAKTANSAYMSRVINKSSDTNSIGLQWDGTNVNVYIDSIKLGSITIK